MKKSYFKLILLTVVCIFKCNTSVAQTTLIAGDMMIIGCDLGANTFRVVLLKDISAGTVIKYTDIAWLSSASSTWEPNSLAYSFEGTITWTTTISLVSGTVLDLNLLGSGTASLTTVGITPLIQSIVVSQMTSTDVVHPNGENLFIYQGNSSNPYFITGFNNLITNASPTILSPNGWTSDGSFIGGFAITTNLPNGNGSQNALTDGVNALAMIDPCRQTQVQYTGLTTPADIPTWKSRFMNHANWSCGASGVTNSITNSIAILPLARNEFELSSKLKMYPNPVSNIITVNFENLTNTFVTIYDVNGRFLKKINLNQSSNKIVISDLESGIYLFKIQSDEGTVTKQIVKE
ncbi:MAG: T9SS type A sorting domain-containing protein [Flavobacterium sp.]|uniref:T9SS type A sorting domain-containing protein n=1 Tax=Flavobacterium sp. TaxID=239 RepID=UPI003266AC3E